jgi:hypothetical protein
MRMQSQFSDVSMLLQVLHTALVMAYLSELKADIVVELAELENVNLLKQVLSSLMNYSTKQLPETLKHSPLVSSHHALVLHAGDRLVCVPGSLHCYLDEALI